MISVVSFQRQGSSQELFANNLYFKVSENSNRWKSPRISKRRSWRTFFLFEDEIANISNILQEFGAPLVCPCFNHTWVPRAGETTKFTDPETNESCATTNVAIGQSTCNGDSRKGRDPP